MADKVKSNIQEIVTKLPEQFAVMCSKCSKPKAVRKDVFVKRLQRVGDVDVLFKQYVCAACRKQHNIDIIGKPKVSGGSMKVITLADIK